MTTRDRSGADISAAIAMRESGDGEAALRELLALLAGRPEDAQLNLQVAWTHDKMGLEREAVPYYEKAIGLGLDGDDLRHALLGLGSTYRALGEYEKAAAILDRAVAEIPGAKELEVFRAMALYNLGRPKEACETLLRLLVETSGDASIRRYQTALQIYAADLDRTWP